LGEGALHRVHGDPLEVVERPAEGVGALRELAGHRRVAHQAVVGVERHAEAQSAQHADRVLGDRLADDGVHVRGGAQVVALPDRDAPRVDDAGSLQLPPKNCRQEVAQHPTGTNVDPGVLVDLPAQESAAVGALLPQDFRALHKFFVVDEQRPALAAREVLRLVETLRGERPERAEVLRLVLREESVGVVFDEHETVSISDLHQRIHFAGDSAVVNHAECPRARCYRRLDERRIDVESV